MKASQLLLLYTGLASAVVLPQHSEGGIARRDPDPKADPDPEAGITRRDPDPHMEHIIDSIAKRGNFKRELVARRIEAWNDFSTPVSGIDACVILQALEFLAASLIEATQDITPEAGTQVFVRPLDQGGPLVLDMRSMMIWQSILDRFKDQLQATNAWSLSTQLQVASCYLEYSQQAGLFLQALTPRGLEFSFGDPAGCLMYDKIEALYISYTNVANRIYGQNTGVPATVEYLETGNFPDPIPATFRTPYAPPAPGSPIADYLAQHDNPEPSSGQQQSQFAQAEAAWQCSEFDQSPNVAAGGAGAPAAPARVAAPAPAAPGAPAPAVPAPAVPAPVKPPGGKPAAGGKPAGRLAGKGKKGKPPGKPIPALAVSKARDDKFEGKAHPKVEELGKKLGNLDQLGGSKAVIWDGPKDDEDKDKKDKKGKGRKDNRRKDRFKDRKDRARKEKERKEKERKEKERKDKDRKDKDRND